MSLTTSGAPFSRQSLGIKATVLALLATAAPSAFAQDVQMAQATTPTAPAAGTPAKPAAKPKEAAPEEVVVTGSRIRAPNLVSSSPVAAVSTQELKLQGTVSLSDLINNQPQAFADQGLSSNGVATGTATVSLRNLGPNRTLVLVDGKRLMPGDPSYPYADLDSVPALMVDRVDILTGGASAVYGSDAIAGVVNFVLKKNFEGVRVDSQYSFAQHDNQQSAFFNPLLAPRKFTQAPSSNVDGEIFNQNLLIGVNSENGKGNITVFANYTSAQPVQQGSRDFSSCTLGLNGAGTGVSCGGSGTSAQTDVINGSGNGGRFVITGPGQARAFTAADQFNFAPYNYFQRNDERYNFGFNGHYEIAKYADVYSDFMFLDDHSHAQLAPGGIFLGGTTIQLPCNSTIVPAAIQADACAGLAPTALATYLPGRRFVEGDGRQDDYRHTAYKIDVGIRGDLSQGWHYDAYGQLGVSMLNQVDINFASNAKIAKATNLVQTKNGVVCQSVIDGTDPNCVPLNLFSGQPLSQAALNYVLASNLRNGETREQIVSGSLDGDLGQYGLKSPLATDGVRVAVGGEYRREALALRPDNSLASGDQNGGSGVVAPVSGNYDVKEFLIETKVPLIDSKPFIKDLSLSMGYRYSDYSTKNTTDTYKFEVGYAPTDDGRFRASYNHAVRAANVIELFTPQTLGLANGVSDPCSGKTPTASLANCAYTGVTAAQYGKIQDCSANQCIQLVGGNPALRPESSNTFTIGAVVTPTFFKGFSGSVDYFKIKVEDVVSAGVGTQLALSQCVSTHSSAFCSLIHRDPNFGTVWIGDGTLNNSGYVMNTNLNSGSIQTSGMDVEATYTKDFADFGMPKWGAFTLALTGTYTESYLVQPYTGSGKYECAGLYGPTCSTAGSANGSGAGIPKWRHKLRLTWDSPWDFTLSAAWRHIGEQSLDGNTNDPFLTSGSYDAFDAKIKAYDYFDLAGQWHVWSNVTLRAGVNNLFDKDPPIVSSNVLAAGGGGNTFPGTYDMLGRRIFVGAGIDF
jgi:outer membrane receptor protein involved in Fe transport